MTHANVGAPNRLAFNVVGPAVNKTARIQSMTKDAGEPLLLSEEFAAHIRRPLRSIGHFDLRGVAGAAGSVHAGGQLVIVRRRAAISRPRSRATPVARHAGRG